MKTVLKLTQLDDGRLECLTDGVSADELGGALFTLVKSCDSVQGQNVFLNGILCAAKMLCDAIPASEARRFAASLVRDEEGSSKKSIAS